MYCNLSPEYSVIMRNDPPVIANARGRTKTLLAHSVVRSEGTRRIHAFIPWSSSLPKGVGDGARSAPLRHSAHQKKRKTFGGRGAMIHYCLIGRIISTSKCVRRLRRGQQRHRKHRRPTTRSAPAHGGQVLRSTAGGDGKK